jgi:hypothetical protein
LASAAIVPIGTAVAAVAAAATLISMGVKSKKSVSYEYSEPFIKNGQCFITETKVTTTTKGFLKGGGSSTDKSEKSVLVETLGDHRMGRGLQIFDTGILQALQLD